MIFKQWLNLHTNDNNVIGDFANDVVADEKFPMTSDYDSVVKYLEEISIDEIRMRSFKKAWKQYSAYISTDNED